MADVKLLDLIDRETLQSIQDGFSNATGMAALTVDLDGPVTNLSNPTDFCMKLTRGSKLGFERCNQCDKSGGEKALREGKATAYYCHGGLVDFAAPIVLNGKQIGSFIGGQVLPEEPDEEKFRKIAAELGIDPNEYVAAVRKVKVIPKKQIDACADFLYIIADFISKIGYSNYIAKTTNSDLMNNAAKLTESLISAEKLADECTRSFGTLTTRFSELNETAKNSVSIVKDTSDTVKNIQNIAMNTRILGFNASIEASRAKESGKGFGVIAQEVRNLADVSKASADKIEDTIKTILDFTSDINNSISELEEMIEKNEQNLNEIKKFLAELRGNASN